MLPVIDRPQILLLLAPSVGHPDRFASLGLAYLLGALRTAGFDAHSINLSHILYASDRELYHALYAAGGLERFYPEGLWGTRIEYLDPFLQDREQTGPLMRLESFVLRCAEAICACDPGLVGMSLLQSNVIFSAMLGKNLRARGLRVLMGGPALSSEAIRRRLLAEACEGLIIGEADLLLPRIVSDGLDKALRRGRTLQAAPPDDLDRLARPDFYVDRLRRLPVLSSRGCVGRCRFCEERLHLPGMRRRRAVAVAREIQEQSERYQTRDVDFHDSLINHRRRDLLELCRELDRARIRVSWRAFARPDRLDGELLDRMASAGCRQLDLGVEHFHPDMAARLGKGWDVQQVEENIGLAADRGIRCKILLMEGLPGERPHHHEKNLQVMTDLAGAWPAHLDLSVNPLMLMPRAPFSKDPQKYGIEIIRDERGQAVQVRFAEGPERALIESWLTALWRLRAELPAAEDPSWWS